VYATRRWVRSKRKGAPCVIHEVAYKCNWSFRGRLHAKQSQIKRCHNPQIKGSLVEGRVLAMVRDVLLDPATLRMHVDFYKEDARKAEPRLVRVRPAIRHLPVLRSPMLLSTNVMIKLIDHEFLFVNNAFYKISN
jgi:hypothetical protein